MYIFDIDGTLANLDHRLHYVQSKPKDWNGFYKAAVKDTLIEDVSEVYRGIRELGAYLAIITGRSDVIRKETEDWLDENDIYGFEKMYMRKAGDHRPDNLVKGELLDELLIDFPQDYYRGVEGIFEDRQQVVDMYRVRGLRVYQVAKGDF